MGFFVLVLMWLVSSITAGDCCAQQESGKTSGQTVVERVDDLDSFGKVFNEAGKSKKLILTLSPT